MGKSRRRFLKRTSLGLLAMTAGANAQPPTEQPPGSPSAFGTAPATGPVVTTETFVEAEKLVQFPMSPAHTAEAAGNWRESMAALYERRTGPRKVAIEPEIAPWSRWFATLPGETSGPKENRFLRSRREAQRLPANDEDIAFASVSQLSRWIAAKQITSEKLTGIYL